MTYLLIILGLSLLVNILFFVIDILPVINRVIERRRFKLTRIKEFEKLELIIVSQALQMLKTRRVTMPKPEQSHFIREIQKRYQRRFKKIDFFHYPKAFLFYGVTEYALIKGDNYIMNSAAVIFNKYFLKGDTNTFTLGKIDQVPFGIAAINLYKYLKLEKYKKIADDIFQELIRLIDENDGIIYYRKNASVDLVDKIGMICPFLVRYGITFNNQSSLKIAKKQLEYYIQYGVDQDSRLPSHAITKGTKIKVGPSNWGRGIGWYIIGLSEYVRRTNDIELCEEMNRLIDTLFLLRTKEFTWTQFPGSSDDFDASATIMIMYGINNFLNRYRKEEIFGILNKWLNNGIIMNTSGDTFCVNNYSNIFGKSDLTQGVLLMLFSTINE